MTVTWINVQLFLILALVSSMSLPSCLSFNLWPLLNLFFVGSLSPLQRLHHCIHSKHSSYTFCSKYSKYRLVQNIGKCWVFPPCSHTWLFHVWSYVYLYLGEQWHSIGFKKFHLSFFLSSSILSLCMSASYVHQFPFLIFYSTPTRTINKCCGDSFSPFISERCKMMLMFM